MSKIFELMGRKIIQACKEQNPSFIGLQLDMQIRARVSNSHSCPKGGVQNFSGTPNMPRSYPGMFGRIWVRYSDDTPSFASSELPSNVHSGTGGYGAYDGNWLGLFRPYYNVGIKIYYYSWDCKLFEADHPEIKAMRADARIRDEDLSNTLFKFYWLDEETRKQDKHLLKRYSEKCKNTSNSKN